MRPLFIFCATALLTACTQAPAVSKSDRDVAAECLGWNTGSELPRPAGFQLSSLTDAASLNDARFVDVDNGQCRNVTEPERFAFDTRRAINVSLYNLPGGRVGVLLTLSEPLGRTSYVGGSF